MNNCVPGRKMESDPRYFYHLLPASNEKNYVGQDDSLIELLWKNGQVVLHNQTSCSSPATVAETNKQLQRPELSSRCRGSHGNSMNMIQADDEAASWYPNPFEDALENEFQEFFFGMQSPDSIVIDKENREELCMNFCSAKDVNSCTTQSSLLPHDSMMLPPKLQVYDSSSHSPGLEIGLYTNLTHQTKSVSEEMGLEIGNFGGVASGSDTALRMGESSSMVTIESRICGSRQDQKDSNNGEMENSLLGSAAQNCRQEIAFDPLLSSSSGDSGSSFRRGEQLVMPNHGHKRKARDSEESEHHIKNSELASPEAHKHAKKAATLRRSRAAEIHNLSERRRRDRINEKMKALQDLIPHCNNNKPDKASMLDEAIEYLKSLQLQVQMLWMGGGMAPMVFPGLHQYMQCAGIGTNNPPLRPILNPVHLPGATLYNHFIPPMSTPSRPPVCLSPGITPVLNFTNQTPNAGFPEPFLRCFGFPQVMDMYAYGAQVMQHNQAAAAVASNLMPSFGNSSQNTHTG